MGLSTFAQVVEDGLQLASAPHLTTSANRWLLAFLRHQYASFRWPFLPPRWGPFTLPAGTQSFLAGSGSTGVASITNPIKSVDGVGLYDSVNNGWKGDLPIRTPSSILPFMEPLVADTSSPGMPQIMLVEVDTTAAAGPYKWKLSPWPVPEKAYRIIITGHGLPGDESAGTPLYPNDETLRQAVYRWASFHDASDDAALQDQVLRGMVLDDRVTYGKASGQPSRHRLGGPFKRKW